MDHEFPRSRRAATKSFVQQPLSPTRAVKVSAGVVDAAARGTRPSSRAVFIGLLTACFSKQTTIGLLVLRVGERLLWPQLIALSARAHRWR